MSWELLIVLGGVLILFVIYKNLVPSLDRVVDRAVRDKDVRPVISYIDGKRLQARPTAYNHAIRRLWDGFQRRLAVELVRALVERHPDARIAQYWMHQVLTVEPGMAAEGLGKEFLSAHYQPEVAARCGPVG